VSAATQYDPKAYRAEKASGERLPNGQTRLKKVTGKHLTCINYHLAGMTGAVIAANMNVTQAWVSKILNDPLVVDIIKQRFVELDSELRALYPQAIRVLSDGMRNDDPMVQLSAADKWFRANGHYGQKLDKSAQTSAEDLVRMMLEKAEQNTSVSLTVSKTHAQSAQTGKIIDHDPVK
jgi:hypothetical protein